MNRTQLGASLNLSIDEIPKSNSNRPGTAISPTSITIHNTGNRAPGADAPAHAKYVKNPNTKVSWHYTVDDYQVIKHLPIDEKGWHAGKDGNRASIAIETCMYSGIDQAAADDRLARLVAVLRHDLGLGRSDIKTHWDWTKKNCPELLRPKWGGLMDKIDAYVEGMNETPMAAVSFTAGADEPEIDHDVVAQNLFGEQASIERAASPIPLLSGADKPTTFDALTMDRNEPDEGFSPWAQSILAYGSNDEIKAVVEAESFAAFSDYKSDFAASYSHLNIRHFMPHEFLGMGGSNGNPASSCHNKNRLPPRSYWPNMQKLAEALDEIRARLGAPVKLTSVYRSPEYNQCLSGTASNSFHMKFKAADFQCQTGSPPDWRRVAREVRADGFFSGGIGLYNTFVHVDVRGYDADW